MTLENALVTAVGGLCSVLGVLWRHQLATVRASIERIEKHFAECEADRKNLREILFTEIRGKSVHEKPHDEKPTG